MEGQSAPPTIPGPSDGQSPLPAGPAAAPAFTTYVAMPPPSRPGFVSPRPIGAADPSQILAAKPPAPSKQGRKAGTGAGRKTTKRPAAGEASVGTAKKKATAGRGKPPLPSPEDIQPSLPPHAEKVVEEQAEQQAGQQADPNMFDDMSQSMDDETYLQNMNFANSEYVGSMEIPSQETEEELDAEDEGFVDNAMAQNLFKGRLKKGAKKDGKKGRTFTLHHCWKELENDEKWKNRDIYEIPNGKNKLKSSLGDLVDVDGDVSSDDEDDDEQRSPTPNSVAKTKRPDGRKAAKEKMKGKKAGDDDIRKSLDAIMSTRMELNEKREAIKMKQMEEAKETELRKVAVEERKAAAEERKAAAEELKAATENRKVLMDERKLAMEEAHRDVEVERQLMFMDTSNMDEKQKAYVEMCRDEVFAEEANVGMGGEAKGIC
ncbi:glutathione S-transferase T3-like [Hordeum vulgare]|nr:glutathione S-transferase T3-like [Hordeum vulgare]